MQYDYELHYTLRLTGEWGTWLDFLAEAVIVTATQAAKPPSSFSTCRTGCTGKQDQFNLMPIERRNLWQHAAFERGPLPEFRLY